MNDILIIDDDPDIRVILRKMLEREGYRILEAEDGRDGLHQLAQLQGRVGLVITDVLMPEKDGLAVIREIRAMDAKVPIVALSGGGMMLSAETSLFLAMKMGAVSSLTKPVSREQLLAAVRQAMSGSADPGVEVPDPALSG